MSSRPLPAHSRALRSHRFEASILGPKNERGGRMELAVGRFVSFDAAQQWADSEHANAEAVNVTLYSARRGWQPQRAAQRVRGEWV